MVIEVVVVVVAVEVVVEVVVGQERRVVVVGVE